MQIFVKMHTGETITLNVNASHSIKDVKAIIEATEGIIAIDQRLFFAGQHLDSRKSLADYNIQNETTLDFALAEDIYMSARDRSVRDRSVRPRLDVGAASLSSTGVVLHDGGGAAPRGEHERRRREGEHEVISQQRVELMRQYSWASQHNRWAWVCSTCGAAWMCYPVIPGHPENVVEVAVHNGGQMLPCTTEETECIGDQNLSCGTCSVEWRVVLRVYI